MLMMVDHVRKMTVKKSCKYGEYGSFQHLLFLLVNFFFNPSENLFNDLCLAGWPAILCDKNF